MLAEALRLLIAGSALGAAPIEQEFCVGNELDRSITVDVLAGVSDKLFLAGGFPVKDGESACWVYRPRAAQLHYSVFVRPNVRWDEVLDLRMKMPEDGWPCSFKQANRVQLRVRYQDRVLSCNEAS